ncbi:hypothetical protein C8Q79DRAFT_1008204 [Trametes meyenii]|nr:hypothetical protein C8Q79DRAFT_1008204 [Trametes meyenii]
MLAKLCEKSPQLHKIDLIWGPSSLPIVYGTLRMLLKQKHLTSINLPRRNVPLTAEVFAHLALLSSITSLSCHFGDIPFAEDDYNLLRTKIRSTLFPSLQQLHLGAKSFAMINELLACIDFPHLTLLSVTALAGAPRCDMVALLQNVGTLCKGIHTLYISCPYIFDGPSGSKQPMGRLSAPAPIDEQTLKSLLSLVGIRDLVLDIHSPHHIDDALLARIAATWPRLTRLKFGGLFPWGALPSDKHVDPHEALFDEQADTEVAHWGLPEDWVRADGPSTAWPTHISRDPNPLRAWSLPPATLSGVLTFLRDCPDITELGVEVDAQPLYESPSTPIHAAQRCAMERLHVGLSPVGDPYTVAAILSDAFPSVHEIKSGWRDLEDHSGQRIHSIRRDQEDWASAKLYRMQWQTVQELVPYFAAVREQERKWRRNASGSHEGHSGA